MAQVNQLAASTMLVNLSDVIEIVSQQHVRLSSFELLDTHTKWDRREC
jgi:hypothetical protein